MPAIYLALISCASPLLTLFGPTFSGFHPGAGKEETRSDSTQGMPDSTAPGFNNTGLRPVLKVKENLATIKTTHHFCQCAACNSPVIACVHVFFLVFHNLALISPSFSSQYGAFSTIFKMKIITDV